MRTITADDRLTALALFTVAKQHAQKSKQFYDALTAHLGTNDSGNFSDLLWATDGGPDVADFDNALTKEGFEVTPSDDLDATSRVVTALKTSLPHIQDMDVYRNAVEALNAAGVEL